MSSSFSLSGEIVPIKQWLEKFRAGFGRYSDIFEDIGIEHSDILQDLDEDTINEILDDMKKSKAKKFHIKSMKKRLIQFVEVNDDGE